MFIHASVKNVAMLNFVSKNGFRFHRYLEDFWGEGTGATFLLVKRI